MLEKAKYYANKRRQFMRAHFKEPTEKQIKKIWDKNQAILGYQKLLLTMPRDTTKEILAWDRVFQTLAKMAGYFVAEQTINANNNVIFVSRAENKAAWEKQAQQQQHDLRIKTKVASDTIINTRDSS